MSATSEVTAVERVKAALFEAGCPVRDGAVFINEDGEVELMFGGEIHGVSLEAWWRAKAIAGVQRRCWPCFSDAPTRRESDAAPPCTHDPLTSPWPEVA